VLACYIYKEIVVDKDCIACGEISEELIDVGGIGGLCEGCHLSQLVEQYIWYYGGAADYITPDYDGEKTWRL
tara:strand:- start:334 stop:549 length:216 start_codon:yes stop_codon:yes gene_type:complete